MEETEEEGDSLLWKFGKNYDGKSVAGMSMIR